MSDQTTPQAQQMPRMPWRALAIGFAAAVFPLALALGYYAFFGTHPDASMQRIAAAIGRNETAQASLGTGIAITGWPSIDICHDRSGALTRYAFSVRGSHGEGAVGAVVFKPIGSDATKMESVTLTAPDGTVTDIVGSAADESWLAPTTRADTTCRHQA
jgi:hypothetical protein